MKQRMKPHTTKIEGKHQIVVRVPVDLHARLVDTATAEGLSVNAKVVALIRNDVDAPRKAAA